MSITINPGLTTNAAGSFNTTSLGYVQGTALADPAVRNALAGGVLAASETLPMWGGVGIYEFVPPNGTSNGSLGGSVGRALLLTGTKALTGFSVFDQDHSMINSPQSPVPLAAAGMGVNFYRLGSGARIAVACDPSLVSLEGAIINGPVSWDNVNQRLQPYIASGATEAVTSMTWSSAGGGRIAVVMTAASVYGLGDEVNVSGATNTGTGGNTVVNGNFIIDTYTDTTHFTLAAPAAAGVYGTIAGTIVLNVGFGALACKVLDVQIGNSLTVDYNSTTGFATWNRSGSTAIILI